MSGDDHPTLAVEDLRREYGPITALEGVSLTIEPGGLHCLVGPNGSGKTTLFRTLLGLTTPTSGTVRRPGATLGVGFQRPVCYDDLTVAENLEVFGRLMDAPRDGWRERIVDVLGLERVGHRRAADLSGGFRKKLDLALALLKRPRFLLLDEPLSDLDDVSKARLVEFLAAYAGAGNAVLVSTHRIDAFADDLDRLTVIHEGEIVFDRSRDELAALKQPLSEVYVELVDAGTDTAPN